MKKTYKENCPKCNGSKRLAHYAHVDGGRCFHCEGRGYVIYKTSPSKRKKSVNYPILIVRDNETLCVFWKRALTESAAIKKGKETLMNGMYKEFVDTTHTISEEEIPKFISDRENKKK